MDAPAAAFGGSFPSMPRTIPGHGLRLFVVAPLFVAHPLFVVAAPVEVPWPQVSGLGSGQKLAGDSSAELYAPPSPPFAEPFNS